MKKHILFIPAFMGLFCSCTHDSKQNSITITNNSSVDKVDEAFVLKREQLPDFGAALPIVVTEKAEFIASQVDDIDQDGKWDELAFVYSLKAGEAVNLKILSVSDDYPEFKKRTHVRLGKLHTPGDVRILDNDWHGKFDLPRGGDKSNPYPYQTDGPAWENDKMGFRHYFDGRNEIGRAHV